MFMSYNSSTVRWRCVKERRSITTTRSMSTASESSYGSFLLIACHSRACPTSKPPMLQLSRSLFSLITDIYSLSKSNLSFVVLEHCSRRGPEFQMEYLPVSPSLCNRAGWRTQTWGPASARLSDCSTSSSLPSLLLLLLCLRARATESELSLSSPAAQKGSLHSFASFLLLRGTETLRIRRRC